jgi:hypothetical protein
MQRYTFGIYLRCTDTHTLNLLTFILLMWRIGRAPISIPMYSYIQQDATLRSLFISGNCSTCFGWYFQFPPIIRSAYNFIYSIWYLSHRYSYLTLSWKSWNRFECSVDGVRHPQHTQTSSNSSTTAADSNKSVTSTRCCRYSSMRSWWWVEVPPETCRAVSRYKWTV